MLNTLLARMDLPYATQPRCTRPPDLPLEGEEYSWDTTLLMMNLVWSLVGSALPPKASSDRSKDLPSLRPCAMWYRFSVSIRSIIFKAPIFFYSPTFDTVLFGHTVFFRDTRRVFFSRRLVTSRRVNVRFSTQCRGLRYSFKRHIVRGQHCAVNLRIRNDIAALILAGIVTFPSWDLVGSGIAEDIVELLGAIEFGTARIWTTDVKFADSDEDLFFRRTLLTIVAHLAHIDVYVFVIFVDFFTNALLQSDDVKCVVKDAQILRRNESKESTVELFETFFIFF